MKERLIGAAVLVAAAVILIPEMLSGPQHVRESVPASSNGEPALKTYTIDLNRSPAAPDSTTPNAAAAVEQPAPAEVLPNQSGAPESSRTPQADTDSAATVEKPPNAATSDAGRMAAGQAVAAEPLARVPPPAAPKPAESPAAPPASRADVPAAKGFAVQLGSFASEATAVKMGKDLQAKGHAAFVMPVKSGGTTLYRVRIGPVPDRATAMETLRNVKQLAPGAAVVAHP